MELYQKNGARSPWCSYKNYWSWTSYSITPWTAVSVCVSKELCVMALFATNILVQGKRHCCPTIGAICITLLKPQRINSILFRWSSKPGRCHLIIGAVWATLLTPYISLSWSCIVVTKTSPLTSPPSPHQPLHIIVIVQNEKECLWSIGASDTIFFLKLKVILVILVLYYYFIIVFNFSFSFCFCFSFFHFNFYFLL